MTDAFIGDIRIVSFSYAPRGWAQCNGQLLPISQNQALFSLLGTMYGGNGQTTFSLPNLQTRVPLHLGPAYTQGQAGGETAHTLTVNELPSHTHQITATGATPSVSVPGGSVQAPHTKSSYGGTLDAPMNPSAVSLVGGSQPHDNMPPYLVLNFIICLSGIFPSRN
jgi:microcystin-dependent protein